MQYWKIIALVGAVIFLISGFLAWISEDLSAVYPFSTGSFSLSLLDVYSLIGRSTGTSNINIEISLAVIGLLMAIVFYPLGIILDFFGTIKRIIALIGGILSLLCWIGILVLLAQLNALSFTGPAVYVGIIGAVILIVAFFVKGETRPHVIVSQRAASPQPPPSIQ